MKYAALAAIWFAIHLEPTIAQDREPGTVYSYTKDGVRHYSAKPARQGRPALERSLISSTLWATGTRREDLQATSSLTATTSSIAERPTPATRTTRGR